MRNQTYSIEYLDYSDFELKDALKLALNEGLSSSDINLLLENGIKKIPVSTNNDIFELVENALRTAFIENSLIIENMKAIYLLHSLPEFCQLGSASSTIARLKKQFKNIPIIPIGGQPCSIFHYGIQLAIRTLKCSNVNSQILLVGLDLAPSHQSRFFFGSAMGDSLVTAVISESTIVDAILGTYSDTYVFASEGEDSYPQDIQKFRDANPIFIRDAIEKCLLIANLQLSDLTWIIPHTPYLKIKDIISNTTNFSKEKILTNYISETGHLNSNDSFIAYSRLCKEKIISQNDISLLINPGFGGTRGVTILKRNLIVGEIYD